MNDLPAGWEVASVADLGQIITGSTPSTKDPGNWGGHIPFVTPGDIKHLSKISTTERTVTDAGAARGRLLPSGAVLVTCIGNLGRTGITSGRCLTNQQINAIVPAEPAMAKYIEFACGSPSFRTQLEDASTSTTVSQVNKSNFSRLLIPVAPLGEQRRIVAAIEEQFSLLDAAVTALERVRRNVKRLKSAAFTLIADSMDAWRTLGEIAEVVGGVTKDAKRQSDPSFAEVPYLRVANVQRGYLDLTEVTTIRVPAATVDKLRLKPGDILFNEGGDRDKLGRGWIWEGQIEDCIHQNHVFRARLLTDEFEPKFVSTHGNTFGQAWFERMGKQTTNLASLNLATLKSFPVPDLPVERQREIIAEVERQLSLLDSLRSVADHSLMRCDLLRSSILAAAFSGRLVPQDPGEEPASALLEQITAARTTSNGHKPGRPGKPRTSQETITT